MMVKQKMLRHIVRLALLWLVSTGAIYTTVAYSDVAQIKGHNLGTGAKIAIGIGIGVGLTILFFYIIYLSYQD
jgi:hypothetical protein